MESEGFLVNNPQSLFGLRTFFSTSFLAGNQPSRTMATTNNDYDPTKHNLNGCLKVARAQLELLEARGSGVRRRAQDNPWPHRDC